MELPFGQFNGLVARGMGLTSEVEQLEGKLSMYNLAKLLVDGETFELMDWFEQEGRRTRLSYHAFYESTHKKWVEWANDVETALIEVKRTRVDLGRFRKLRDQINRFYSKREIDLPSIVVQIKEQVAIVERLTKTAETIGSLNPRKPRKALPRGPIKKNMIDHLIQKIEKNPYYRVIGIIAVVATVITIVLAILAVHL